MNGINFKENFRRIRKSSELSQDELAYKLGITSQAVSKWECGLSYPDITLLIPLADLFGITVDELLRGDTARIEDNTFDLDKLGVHDDEKLRVVQFIGQRMLREDDYDPDIRIPLLIEQCDNDEKTVNVELWGSADIEGSINGSVNAGAHVSCSEGINGGVNAGSYVNCGDGINGGVTAGSYVDCGDGINGGVNVCGDLKCGDISGNVKACGSIECDGDIGGNAEAKDGNISCGGDVYGTVKCKTIDGDVNAEGDVICEEVRGNINAESVYLGKKKQC